MVTHGLQFNLQHAAATRGLRFRLPYNPRRVVETRGRPLRLKQHPTVARPLNRWQLNQYPTVARPPNRWQLNQAIVATRLKQLMCLLCFHATAHCLHSGLLPLAPPSRKLAPSSSTCTPGPFDTLHSLVWRTWVLFLSAFGLFTTRPARLSVPCISFALALFFSTSTPTWLISLRSSRTRPRRSSSKTLSTTLAPSSLSGRRREVWLEGHSSRHSFPYPN